MIDRGHDLSITRQAEVLKISRGSVYYLPRPASSADLAIMRHLDRLHLEFPFAGSPYVAEACWLCGGVQDRPPACEDADAADGDRSALSPSAHHPSPNRATRSIRICCAIWRSRGRAGCGRRTSPTSGWRVASLSGGGDRLVQPLCDVWRVSLTLEARSASRRFKMLWPVTARRISSTPTRAASSPVRPSPTSSLGRVR